MYGLSHHWCHRMAIYQLTVFYGEMRAWIIGNLKIEVYIRIVTGIVVRHNWQLIADWLCKKLLLKYFQLLV